MLRNVILGWLYNSITRYNRLLFDYTKGESESKGSYWIYVRTLPLHNYIYILYNEYKENCLSFWNMLHFHIFTHCRISCFCGCLGTLAVFGTNTISKQIPISEQNVFSNDVGKWLNYHLHSSDCIKTFQIK